MPRPKKIAGTSSTPTTTTQRSVHTPSVAELSPNHEAYFTAHGIPADFAAACGARSVSGHEAEELLGFPLKMPQGGILFAYRGIEPRFLRVRLDDGTYLSPQGRDIPIYLPLGTDVSGTSLTVCEGPTKAMALAEAGFHAIGVGGDATTLTRGFELNDSWRSITLSGRDVVILFDDDLDDPNSPLAYTRLAMALERAGATVRVAFLPAGKPKMGADEFLVANGAQALNDILDHALPADPVERVAAITSRLTAESAATELKALAASLEFTKAIHARGVDCMAACRLLFEEAGTSLAELGATDPSRTSQNTATTHGHDVNDGDGRLAPLACNEHPSTEAPKSPLVELPTWGGSLEWIDPGKLCNHRLWQGTLGFEPTEAEEELIEFVRDSKVLQPLIVTGAGCASGPDVILDGHRRRQAAMDARLPAVPVVRRTELPADAEEATILKAALSSKHARKLRPSQLAVLEARLHELYAKRSGFRSDLVTSVATNEGPAGAGSAVVAGDALTLVAEAAQQPRNAVANRRKVFSSPVSPKVLREAVDNGALSLTAAAEMVRATEGRDEVRDALHEMEPGSGVVCDVIKAAEAALEDSVRERIRKPKRGARGDGKADHAPVVVRAPLNGGAVHVRLGAKTFTVHVAEITEADVVLELVPGSLSKPPARASAAEIEPAQTPPASRGIEPRRHLPLLDPFGRNIDDRFIQGEIARGAWRPLTVAPSISGMTRPMTILLAERKTDLVKFAYHGDEQTFCPPSWADIAIGSGACGFGCRSCFLMLTFRGRRDPLRPVVYDNGDDFEREVLKWLSAERWLVEGKGLRPRSRKDTIGLGIDCADSLLWEGVTGHARRLIPLFTNAATNPKGNALVLLTKSANTHYLEQISNLPRENGKVPNVVVSMSLNPENVADLWEGKFPDTLERITPPISKRLEALRYAQDLGFEVRVRIDPILTPVGWEQMYSDFFHDMAHTHGLKPTMLTLGSHRAKLPQLDTWRGKWDLPALEWRAETAPKREGTHFHMVDRAWVYQQVRSLANEAFGGTGALPAVSLCKETHEIRREAGFCNANCNCLKANAGPHRSLPIYDERLR